MAGISDIIGNIKNFFQQNKEAESQPSPTMNPEDEGKTFGNGEFYYDDPNLIQFIQKRANENGTDYQDELFKFVEEVEGFYRDKNYSINPNVKAHAERNKKAEGGIASVRDFTGGGGVNGPGTGTSDSIPALLSDGEFVMTADAVKGFGGGSRKQGAQKLYSMMRDAESGARNKKRS